MKVMKKTRWGAIALVITLVLTSGLTLTGCDNGPGSGRGFDPVGGTWRGTETWTSTDWVWVGDVQQQVQVIVRSELTITFFANGTGTSRNDRFRNNQFESTHMDIFHYSVIDNAIHFVFPGGRSVTGMFTDNNTFIVEGITFRRH